MEFWGIKEGTIFISGVIGKEIAIGKKHL